MNDTPSAGELDWVAFCYLAGELPESDAADFERLLAIDQTAREALAQAVALSQTVAAAESHVNIAVRPGHRTSRYWNMRLSWMAIGSLASALLLVLWSGVVGPAWKSARDSVAAPSKQQLAHAWTQARSDFSQVTEAAFEPGLASLASEHDEDSLADMRLHDEADDDAPSWLTVAVLLAYERPAHDSVPDHEPARLEN